MEQINNTRNLINRILVGGAILMVLTIFVLGSFQSTAGTSNLLIISGVGLASLSIFGRVIQTMLQMVDDE